MFNYSNEYILAITEKDAYPGFVKTDDDLDFLRLYTIEFGNCNIDEDLIKPYKDMIKVRPFTTDVKKNTILSIYILPKI